MGLPASGLCNLQLSTAFDDRFIRICPYHDITELACAKHPRLNDQWPCWFVANNGASVWLKGFQTTLKWLAENEPPRATASDRFAGMENTLARPNLYDDNSMSVNRSVNYRVLTEQAKPTRNFIDSMLGFVNTMARPVSLWYLLRSTESRNQLVNTEDSHG